MINLFSLNICKELIFIDLAIFKKGLKDKLIDLTIWVTLSLFVTAYIMPYFGLSSDYGQFQLGGIIAAIGLFELYTSVIDMVSDFEGDKIIDYNLVLPISSYLVFISKVIYFYLIYTMLTICMIPVGMACIYNSIDLSNMSYIKLFLAINIINVFYACFTIWAASVIQNIQSLGQVWSRFIFPMWFMGGFQFSWFSFYKTFPKIAYLDLFNPIIYITESIRASMLGQNGYINFWLCIIAIIVFSIIFFLKGYKNLKKRLDFI